VQESATVTATARPLNLSTIAATSTVSSQPSFNGDFARGYAPGGHVTTGQKRDNKKIPFKA